ncbi:MAG: alpha/beta hydrolase [Opitutales bacterium]|nr:alpha/beta hydrolase [Opitutales bacterium]
MNRFFVCLNVECLWTLLATFVATSGLVSANPVDSVLGVSSQVQSTQTGTSFYLLRDVPYLGADRSEKLDLYVPVSENDVLKPAVVIVHGGGWARGNMRGERQVEFAHFMVDEGYIAASISYKLSQYEGAVWSTRRLSSSFPQNIYDVKSAVRFLRYHQSSIGVDPERIAMMGGSAGGHLAMLAGLTADSDVLNRGGLYTEQSNEVSAIVSFYGIPDVRRWGGHIIMDYPEGFDPQRWVDSSGRERTRITREWIASDPESWALASPVEHLSPTSPPFFVTHGTGDTTVPVRHSDRLVDALRAMGIPHEYHRIRNAPHTYSLKVEGVDLRPALRAFLNQNL